MKMLKKREKEQKRKEKKAAGKEEPSVPGDAAAASGGQDDEGDGQSETQKKIKALNKKLRQIEQIKTSAAEGKTLDVNQKEKLGMEGKYRKELAALQAQK
eukprot:c12236_g1_i1.p1 GENE.c12236_g1_i1~~c12236_g1_i1.p1  ORF type:complete len:100 (+),score=34.11 c12236_g1_i1:428-727(+)